MLGGNEWLIDAQGCDPGVLSSLDAMRSVCEAIIHDLRLHVLGRPQWHQFPQPAGVTGLYLLSESHLACHTFPESGLASFNLYCCRPKPDWAWNAELTRRLQAAEVQVRCIDRFAQVIARSASSG